MTWITIPQELLTPELISNLENYTQMKVICWYVGLWVAVVAMLVILIAMRLDRD